MTKRRSNIGLIKWHVQSEGTLGLCSSEEVKRGNLVFLPPPLLDL